MGITLTSKTVSSTYDSLLKLSDNDQLTGAFKLITDGLGNDSGISINNSGDVNISGTLVVGERVNTPILQLTGGVGTQGTMSWNADEETVDLIQNGATLQLGQEVQIHCKNQTGATIPDGTPVYVTGTLGASGRLTIAPMIADGSIQAKYFIGVTTEDIADGEDGKVTTFGKIRGLNTAAYSEGQTLWVSATTAGAFVTTRPVAPNLDLEVAIVINSHVNNGTLFVRSSIGHYLGTAHDVNISSVAENDLLVYKTNRWVNSKSIGDLSAANVTLTGYLRGPATFVIDPAAYGDETGLVQILGDLRVDGTTTTINSTTISVSDKNITLAKDAATAGDANGAGITIAGASATLTYLSATDDFTFNKNVNASRFVGPLTGDVTGNADTASALATARNIALDGSVTGNANFDGSGNITITTTTNHNHDDRYYTETESDNRFVNVSGDTMTGALIVSTSNSPGVKISKNSTVDNRYLRLENTESGGKSWDLINQQSSGGNVFMLYNHTDDITALSVYPNGNINITGTITASGYNKTNWDAAYSYSQIGHLPLAGGELIGTNNNLVIDEIAENTWAIQDTFQDNGILINSGSGGLEFQYNGVTEMTIDGSGVSFTGTFNLDAADLNIGSADIIFGTTSGGATRGLIWSVSGSGFLSKLIGGGADGGKVTLYANMDDAITTGNIFEIKDGSTGSLFLGLSHAGILTAGGGTSTQWNTAYNYSQVGHLPLTGGTINGAVAINSNTTGLTLNRDAVTNYNGIYYSTANSPKWFVGMRENLSSNNHIHYSEQLGVDVFTLNVSTGDAAVYGNIYASGGNSSQWTTAYGWGNHAGLYSLLGHTHNYLYSAPTQLTSTNLNDLSTSGVYFADTEYGTNTSLPIANYFTMLNIMSGSGRQAQLFFGDTPGSAYWRPRQGPSVGWHPWENLITSHNIGSQSVANASTLDSLDSTQFLRSDESDTMSGSLTINASGVGLNVSSSQNTGLIVDGGTNSGIISEFKNSTTKAVINTSGGGYFLGDVSIGSTSPIADGLTIRREGSDRKVLLKLDRPNTAGLQTAMQFTVNNIMVGQIQHEYAASNYNHMSFTLRKPDGDDVIPLWLQNSGNVGIGTTSPAQKLHVDGAIKLTSNPSVTGDGSSVHFWNQSGVGATIAAANFQVQTNGTSVAMHIDSSQQVGIGTTNPKSKLHVAKAGNSNGGSLLIGLGGSGVSKWSYLAGAHYNQDTGSGNGSGAAGVALIGCFSDSTTNNVYIGGSPYEINAATSITFNTHTSSTSTLGGSPRMHIDSSGNVGIGTTSPSSKLHVAGDIRSEGPDGGMVMRSWQASATYGMIGTANMASQEYALLTDGTDTLIGGGSGGYTYIRSGNNDSNPQLVINGTNSYFDGGNVGIGTSSPAYKLQVDGSTGVRNGSFFIGDESGSTNSAIEFYKYGTALRMYTNTGAFGGTYGATFASLDLYDGVSGYNTRISGNGNSYFAGNIGVGVTPTYNVHTAAASRFHNVSIGGGGSGSTYEVYSDSVVGFDNLHLVAQGSGAVYVNSALARPMYINPVGGNVGIGMTNPDYALDVYNTGASTSRVRVQGTSNFTLLQTQNSSGVIYIGIDSSTANGFGLGNYTRIFWSSGNYPLAFAVNDAERVRISPDGNVGIGTTSPVSKLHVVGEGDTVTLQKSNNIPAVAWLGSGANKSVIEGGDNFNFYTGGSSRVYIQNGGNVGIGTTSPSTTLTIGRPIDSAAYGSGTRMIDFKSYYPGYDTDTIKASIYAGVSNVGTLRTDNGYLAFMTSNSGTLYERLRIETNGNIGIGKTTGIDYKLDVAGDISTANAVRAGNIRLSGTLVLSGSGAELNNSTGARLSESYGALWNFSNSATWHHQIINGSSLIGFSAGGVNHGNGNVKASGDVIAYASDKRLKRNITKIENAVEKVLKINGVTYTWDLDLCHKYDFHPYEGTEVGVLAQEIQAVLPEVVQQAPFDYAAGENGELVSKSGENYLTVKYEKIVPLLIEAIKEQQKQIDELKAIINGSTK